MIGVSKRQAPRRWRARDAARAFFPVPLVLCLVSIALATATFFSPEDLPLRTVVVLIAAFVVFKHRTNIGRIIRGKESRLGRKAPGASAASDRE